MSYYTPIRKFAPGGAVVKTPFKGKVDIEDYLKGIGNEQHFTNKQYDLMSDIWDYLQEKGVSMRNAAALMGNIMQESGFDRNAVNPVTKASGLFQLLGSRLTHYNKWLQSHKTGRYPEIDYMLWVINTGYDPYTDGYKKQRDLLERAKAEWDKYPNNTGLRESYNKILEYTNKVYGERERDNRLFPVSDFKKAWDDNETSLEDLTTLFEETFERADKGAEHEKRTGYAKSFY